MVQSKNPMMKTANSPINKTGAFYARDREYSIWLVPTGPARLRLRGQIEALSKKHGTPDFEPHVTLVGLGAVPPESGEGLEGRIARLAGALRPFDVHLREVGQLDAFFRSLFVKVEPTPDVMRAGEMGRRLFKEVHQKEPADPEYFPHLSLLYSDLAADEKQKIISTELADLGVRDDRSPINIAFEVSKLEIRDTATRDTRNWRLLRELPLARPPSRRALEKKA